MQGSLKIRDKADIEKIIKSIIVHGFSFPFFIWKQGKKNYALDGHGRIAALKEMARSGYYLDSENTLLFDDGPGWTIPPLPTVYISASTMDEAKVKLLKLNSKYGIITEASFKLFTNGLKALDLTAVNIAFEKIDIKVPDLGNSFSPPVSNTATETRGAPSAAEPEIERYKPDLEPEIYTKQVSEKDIERTGERLENCMANRGIDETIRLDCPCCGGQFAVTVADILVLIERARK
jgi:hypothetical protein